MPGPLILILDAKIQKQRLRDMKNAAQKRKINTTEGFSSEVTHIVTEFDNTEAVLRKLDIASEEDLCGAQVVKVKWFTDCMKAGHVIDVTDDHRIVSMEKTKDSDKATLSREQTQPWMTDYACQRATPLNHLNGKFTEALEILQEHAELRDGDHDYSRALAFRRASCVLKSMTCELTNMNQLRKVLNIGDHSRRIIQEILEEGESPEVDDIRTSSWFQKMRLFSGVFGIGPSTAKKWIEKGWSTIREAQQGHTSGDWRVNWGLGFHEDLITPVTQAEAVYIKNLVQSSLKSLLPGATMEVTGGFRRGKKTGHDVDILITHREEGREVGVLPRLLRQLQSHDVILCGKMEKSTFSEEVLRKDFKISMRGQLDHFEKWIGIFKVPKSISTNQTSDTNIDILYHRSASLETEHLNEGNTEAVCGTSVEKSHRQDTENKETKDTGAVKIIAGENGEVNKKTGPDKTRNPDSDRNINLNESVDDYEPVAKRQRAGVDLDVSPLELSEQPRNWLARRVDLIVSPYNQYYYALVGWTGNKQFNRDLRLYATRELGMHLTSHGLYDLKKSLSLPADSEEKVFENLKIPYRKPSDRNC